MIGLKGRMDANVRGGGARQGQARCGWTGVAMICLALSASGCSGFVDFVFGDESSGPTKTTYNSPSGYKVGKPYKIGGKWYYPREDYGYAKTGVASWYGPNFHGRRTANGDIYDQFKLTAAHRTLPMPSLVRVTNLGNGRSVDVVVNDRGPFSKNRIIDMSRRGAEMLGFVKQGTARVRVEILQGPSRQLKQAANRGGPTVIHSRYGAGNISAPPRRTAGILQGAMASGPGFGLPGGTFRAVPNNAGMERAIFADLELRPLYPPPPKWFWSEPKPRKQIASADPNARYGAPPTPRPATPPADHPNYHRPAHETAMRFGKAAPNPAPVTTQALPEPTVETAGWTPPSQNSVIRIPPPLDRDPEIQPDQPPPAPSALSNAGQRDTGQGIEQGGATEATPAPGIPIHASGSGYEVQAGAFSSRRAADDLRSRLSGLTQVEVLETHVNGRTLYRVRSAPIADLNAARALQRRLGSGGFTDTRIIAR